MRSTCKPRELLECYPVAAEIFDLIKAGLTVSDQYVIDLTTVDSAKESLVSRKDVAAFTMRKAQALRHLSTQGTRTRNDVVVTNVAELAMAMAELASLFPPEQASRLLDLRDKVVNAGRAASAAGGNGLTELE